MNVSSREIFDSLILIAIRRTKKIPISADYFAVFLPFSIMLIVVQRGRSHDRKILFIVLCHRYT